MTTIEEGAHILEFSDDYWVVKLDDSTFYRKRMRGINTNIKCVDIVAQKDNQLVLIEIKDYRLGLEQLKQDLGTRLTDQLLQKAQNTISTLYLAGRSKANLFDFVNSRLLNANLKIRYLLLLESKTVKTKLSATQLLLNKQNDQVSKVDNLKLQLTEKLLRFNIQFDIFDSSSRSILSDIQLSISSR